MGNDIESKPKHNRPRKKNTATKLDCVFNFRLKGLAVYEIHHIVFPFRVTIWWSMKELINSGKPLILI